MEYGLRLQLKKHAKFANQRICFKMFPVKHVRGRFIMNVMTVFI